MGAPSEVEKRRDDSSSVDGNVCVSVTLGGFALQWLYTVNEEWVIGQYGEVKVLEFTLNVKLAKKRNEKEELTGSEGTQRKQRRKKRR